MEKTSRPSVIDDLHKYDYLKIKKILLLQKLLNGVIKKVLILIQNLNLEVIYFL